MQTRRQERKRQASKQGERIYRNRERWRFSTETQEKGKDTKT